MSIEVQILIALCACLHGVLFVLAARNILRNYCSSLDFLVVVHSAFVLFPMTFDALYGRPYYRLFPILNVAVNDEGTYVLFLFYMMASGAAFYLSATRTHWFAQQINAQLTIQRFRWFFLFGASAVLLYLPACPDYGSLFSYAYIQQTIPQQSPELQSYYSNIYRLSYIVLACSAALLLERNRPVWVTAITIPLLTLAIYINGKRNIVLLAILFFLVAFRLNGILAGKRFATVSVLLVVSYGVYHLTYAELVRTFIGSQQARLEASRLDFGHDLDICLALFLEKYGEQQKLLEYRGQSFLFTVAMYVPRAWWPTKPYPYYHYLTGKALGQTPGQTRWGLTSSWLGECVANLGYIGMLFAPLSLILLCRTGDQTTGAFSRLMTVVVACLFLSLDPSSFMVLLLAWGVLIVVRNV